MAIKGTKPGGSRGKRPSRDHQKYLAKVPSKVVRQRLAYYRLSPDILPAVPVECMGERIHPKLPKWWRFVHPLDVRALDDLKNWVGVPNAVARQQLARPAVLGNVCDNPMMRNVAAHALPRKAFRFEALDHVERKAVHDLAHNLLYGYVDDAARKRPEIAQVSDWMVERAQGIQIFVLPDLVVCPDQVVTFEGFATLWFNNILVYGTGQVRPGNQVKVDAYQIRHV